MNADLRDSVPLGSEHPQNQVDDSVPLGSHPLKGVGGTWNQVTSPGGVQKGTELEPSQTEPSRENLRDAWCTPAWLAEAIGKWDLDPCSNSRSHVRADRRFALEDGEDGLAYREMPLGLRVFVNPPYSRGQLERWVARYATRAFAFCFLVRLDPSTRWFHTLYRASSLVCMPRRRVHFEPPPGIKAGNDSAVRFPHVLFYAREVDATPAILRACFAWRTNSR